MALESLEHFHLINNETKKIKISLDVLRSLFTREQRTVIEDGLIDALSAQAQALLAAAMALKEVSPPPPVEIHELTGFPIINGYPQDPDTLLYHSVETGEVLDPQPEIPVV